MWRLTLIMFSIAVTGLIILPALVATAHALSAASDRLQISQPRGE